MPIKNTFRLFLFLIICSGGMFLSSVSAKDSVIMDDTSVATAKAEKVVGSLEVIDRSKYRKIYHFYGDSISRGGGNGRFESVRPLNRIQDIAQKYIADQGIGKNEIYFRYAWSLAPQGMANDLRKAMADDLRNGIIRKGDVVLFEDAGPHQNNIEKRSTYLKEMIAIFKNSGVPLVFTTMFDYSPPVAYFNSYYDQPISDNESMNRLVVRLADACCDVLDWNAQMDNLSNRISIRHGIYPTHPDGVHPNIIGNLLLAKATLNYLGIPTINSHPMKLLFREELRAFCKEFACGQLKLSNAAIDKIFEEIDVQAGSNILVEKPKFWQRSIDISVTLKAYFVGFYRSIVDSTRFGS